MMQLEVKQWGNSRAVRLPKDFGVETGDFLELSAFEQDKIVFVIKRKAEKSPRKRLSLDERIAQTISFATDQEWENTPRVGEELL